MRSRGPGTLIDDPIHYGSTSGSSTPSECFLLNEVGMSELTARYFSDLQRWRELVSRFGVLSSGRGRGAELLETVMLSSTSKEH